MKWTAIVVGVGLFVPFAANGQEETGSLKVVLDAGWSFEQATGEVVQLRGGIYNVESAGTSSLRLVGVNEVVEVPAEVLDLEETPEVTQAFSFEDENSLRHVVLVPADGPALGAIGRKENEVQERGTRIVRYTALDRTKITAQAIQPYLRYTGTARDERFGFSLVSPTSRDTWIHNSPVDIRWRSFGDVGDKVNIRLMKGDSLVHFFDNDSFWLAMASGHIASDVPNNGSYSGWTPPIWLQPDSYQVLVESSDNSAIFARSQVFSARVTEPCEIEGTLISCYTVYLKGYQKFSNWGTIRVPSRPGGWKRVWLTDVPVYSERGGKAVVSVPATGPIPDDKYYSIRLESGGYEQTVSCGAFGKTCKRKHFGLISKTYFLHGEPND